MPKSQWIYKPRDLALAQVRMLQWYESERRQLPWRETRDPYRIWISEIMLQQTRVVTVLDYYRKFLTKFPTVLELASADEAEVLAAWSGLGYYRRARAMHAAARKVATEYEGRFPVTSEELLKLPGVGRYTAAAVASIAQGEAVAVVDGNVERVLSRVLGRDLRDRAETWELAELMLERRRPGDWNQAMMELGATICLPVDPKCLVCPMQKWCTDPGRATPKKKEIRHKRELVFRLARRKDSVYLVQRAAQAKLMAGMWELPSAAEPGGAKVVHQARHSITNSDYSVLVVEAEPKSVTGGKWFVREKLTSLPITGLTRKILRGTNLWPSE